MRKKIWWWAVEMEFLDDPVREEIIAGVEFGYRNEKWKGGKGSSEAW